ncbi:hypothetical protein [Acinetobacter sp. MB5]|uniref:hypothetical protein n=1 Tax=Acinetobacter sp. MB5 TaxID=2069438 RepID=UPI000DD0AA90|nr:hypothetical protein [Acinetobacter sp. MB5]
MNYSRYSYINPNAIDLFGTLNRNRALTQSEVSYLFAKRGIIFGKDTPRDLLAREFSSYFHSSYDYLLIEAALAIDRKKTSASGFSLDGVKSLTNRQIVTKLDQLEDSLKRSIQKDQDEVNIDTVTYKRNGISSRQIDLKYSVYDFTKNAFNRRDRREASIFIKPLDHSESIYIEFPNIKEINYIVETQILPSLMNNFPGSQKTKVELKGITNLEHRKFFFNKLIRGIEDFEYDTVIDIFVTKSEDPEDNEKKSPITSVASIRKASFSGQGLMDVPELDNLLTKGFHIYRVIWQSESSEGETFVFEAKFSNPDECLGFAYLLKGRKSDDKIEQCSLTETLRLNREIYFSAVRSLKATKELGESHE